MDLEAIRLSRKSQRKTNTVCHHIQNLKSETNKQQKKDRSRLPDTENKREVTSKDMESRKEGQDRDQGIKMYKLPYTKEISNKDTLDNTGDIANILK